jgi:putative Mn2+ efflux pump MntP
LSNRTRFSAGHIGVILAILAGVWLIIAPTWVGFAAHKRLDIWAGVALIIIGAATLFLQWAFGVKDLVEGRQEQG